MIVDIGSSLEFREWDRAGRFTRMLGQLTLEDDGILLETSGSISIAGPLKIKSKELIPWSDLEEIGYTRRFLRPWKIKVWIRVQNLSAFADFPSAIGDYFEARSLFSIKQVRQFTIDANLAIAEARSENLSQKIEGGFSRTR